MRSCALIALASVTALALTLPFAAEEPARTSSVAKQTAPQLQVPSLLAPPQAATASPSPTRASPVPSDSPSSSVHAAARPTEVKTETYMRSPVPAVPAPAVPVVPQTAAPSPPPDMTGDAQASRERDGGFTSPDQLMDWISNYRDHKEPWRVPARVRWWQGGLMQEGTPSLCPSIVRARSHVAPHQILNARARVWALVAHPAAASTSNVRRMDRRMMLG